MKSACCVIVVLAACQQNVPVAVRAKTLFDHSEWIGNELRVDLYEPFYYEGSSTRPRELDVQVADVGASRLALAMADGDRLPANMRPPVHVRATLHGSGNQLRLLASDIEPFEFPAPTRIDRPADILKDKARWSGAMVTFEADWMTGFEGSYVDDRIWIELYPTVKEVCGPPPRPEVEFYVEHSYRVRVVGVAHTAGKYGHQSGSDGEIVATEVIYLDPKRPECH